MQHYCIRYVYIINTILKTTNKKVKKMNMKKLVIITTLLAILPICASAQNNDPIVVQVGYSYASKQPFNMNMNVKWGDRWGMFFGMNGYGTLGTMKTGINYGSITSTEVIYDRFDYENIYGGVGGVLYRPIKKTPFYLSVVLGYGVKEINWKKYVKYDFTYIKDEYNLISYVKDKKSGVNFQFGAQYDLYINSLFAISIESYYNSYVGLGIGVSFGVYLTKN